MFPRRDLNLEIFLSDFLSLINYIRKCRSTDPVYSHNIIPLCGGEMKIVTHEISSMHHCG